MDYLKGLNTPQREAVEHFDGPMLVLAGAGSGKTRVLTYRIVHLLNSGKVAARNVLAVTFTNKAAGEMRRRMKELGGDTVKGMWIGTFHSICMRILRMEAETIGYTSDFVIYDRDDQLKLIKEVLKALDMPDNQYKPRAIINRISGYKNELLLPDAVQARCRDFREERVARAYAEYMKRLKRNNAFDFDDLIMHTALLFAHNDEVLEKYQNRFKYLLVDEYQDTNHGQYILVSRLARKNKNICVVGDDDQSIYGWRGADISNILNFDADFPGARVVKLEQNYRSTKNIVNAASTVIEHNKGRKGKKLWSDLEEGDKLTVIEAMDEKDEAATLVERLQLLVKGGGRRYRDMAILYRTNAQSRVLEERLRKSGIPYALVGSTRFYDRREVKDVLAYLKVIVNPRDGISLKRIINTPKRDIGATTFEKLELYAFEHDVPLYEVFEHVDAIEGIPPRKKEKLKAFWVLIEKYMQQAKDIAMVEVVTSLLDETGYVKSLGKPEDPDTKIRLENVQELLVGMEEYQERTGETAVKTFLAEVSLMTDVDAWDEQADMVTLMTLHCAKGLEFPVVYLTGLEEGLFPLAGSLERADDLEEERRLFYVGVTRAHKKVYLFHARNRRRYEQVMVGAKSRFIEEIPDELLVYEKGVMAGIYKQQNASFTKNRSGQSNHYRKRAGAPSSSSKNKDMETALPAYMAAKYSKTPNRGIEVGQRVRHATFGMGEVTMKRGVGDTAQVTVKFSSGAPKKLLLKYAQLKPA